MSQINVDRVVDASGGVLAPISSVMRNRLINSDMRIDQRNAGAVVTVGSGAYPVDRWFAVEDTDGVLTAEQVEDAPAGFYQSTKLTVTTADASLSASQSGQFRQAIEGNNIYDLNWGTVNAKTVTVSFWVKSSLTGTFGGSLRNATPDRSYVFQYTINAANTWEYKTTTITGDTSGTWGSGNGVGIYLTFDLGSGTDRNGTANAWQAGSLLRAAGNVSLISTLSATLNITGVQLEVGTQATSFEYRQYTNELALCQRYYEVGTDRNALIWSGITSAAGTYYTNKGFCTTKRASATVTTSGEVVSGFVSASPSLAVDSTGIQASRNSSGTPTTSAFYFYNWQASAEL